MSFLYDYGIVRVGAFQHTACCYNAVFPDGRTPQNDHVAADPGVVADFHRGCQEFFCFDTAGDTEVVVVVIDLRVRADLDGFPNDDFFHAGDADAVSQCGIAADFQKAVSRNRQSGAPVGTDALSKAQRAPLRDNHFRVRRKALNAIEAKMASAVKLHNAKLYGAEQHADQIKQASAHINPAFLPAVTRSIHG